MPETPSFDVEALLRQALAPVEPPKDLARRLESHLADLHGQAADELERWELAAIADPKQWPDIPRVAAAAAVTAAAGAGLVALRVRAQHRRRVDAASDPLQLAETTLRAVADETRRLLDR
jgi:negative regulator of sigma E activity